MTIAEYVKIVFKLPGIRRAPGPSGQMKKINMIMNETDTDLYIQRNGTLSWWPGSLQLMVSTSIIFSIFKANVSSKYDA